LKFSDIYRVGNRLKTSYNTYKHKQAYNKTKDFYEMLKRAEAEV